MNNIGPATPSITPAPDHPNSPCAPDHAQPDVAEDFAAVLQQSGHEPEEVATAPGPAPFVEALSPAPSDELPDAEVQAGILAMFGQPVSASLPEPVPVISQKVSAVESHETDTNSEPRTVPDGNREALPAASSAAKSVISFAAPTRLPVALARAPAPSQILPPSVGASPQSASEVEPPLPEAQPSESENAAPQLVVANVLGIIPPVQSVPAAILGITAPPAPSFAPPPGAAVTSAPRSDAAADSLPGPVSALLPTNLADRRLPVVQRFPSPAVMPQEEVSPRPSPVAEANPSLFSEPAVTQPTISAIDAELPAQPTPAPAPAAVAAVKIPPATQSFTPPVIPQMMADVSTPPKNAGMTAAKPGSAMFAPTSPRSQRAAPAVSAEAPVGEVAPILPTLDGFPAPRTAPVLAPQEGREHSAEDHAADAEPALPAASEATAPAFPNNTATPHLRGDSNHFEIKPAEIVQVVTHTLQATERLIASGQERVELAVKLENGTELTIHLRVANGQVTPVFRTESEPLRAALEQNWSRFSQRGGESDLHITTPVFESPQASSNMSDPHQQREGRQRAFHEPAPEFPQSPTPRRSSPLLHPKLNPPAPALPGGVKLYA